LRRELVPRDTKELQFTSFVPPPRFGATSFEAYQPTHPSQAQAVERVSSFVQAVTQRPNRWRFQRRAEGTGMYLDGGFGVGKTHLLAAAWHASSLPLEAKRYLSFQELVYVLGVLGREGAAEAFRDVRLVCLDEFELDDPGNTLLIAMFLRQAFERGIAVLTTSNTDPASQGTGRFAAADFKREIQGIAARFEVIALEGADYRSGQRDADWTSGDEAQAHLGEGRPGRVHLSFSDLLSTLASVHPIHYRGMLQDVDLLLVEDVKTIPDQNTALRFVHFIDKLYDLGVHLRATGQVPMNQLFADTYREGAYAKKHHRCTSRLHELLGAPVL